MIYSLQIYRGVAAILVVLFHAQNIMGKYFEQSSLSLFFKFGYSGVDFFFALSGFIIFYIHHQDFSKGLHTYKKYFLKRSVRVLPIYWLITILVIPIWFIFPEFGGDYHRDFWSIFMSLFLIPQEGNLPHISVAWTLSYEILFYFLFSFFIINKKIGFAVIFIWQILVVYYLFTNPEYHYLVDFIFNKYNLLFLVGILAAKVSIYFNDTVEDGALFFVFGSFLFILVGVFDNLYNTHSNEVFELFYGIPAFIILVYSNSNKINYYFSTKKMLILLGDASYSIYLIHTFALSFFAKIFYYINLKQHISSEFLFLILSVLAIIAGVLVHIILEKRLLTWIWLNLLNKKL